MSTSGYPGTGGGSRIYTGAGNNPNQAGGYNYVDLGGLSSGTTYYFTCTSYCDALGWGTSYNIAATTKHTIESIIRSMRPNGGTYTLFNCRLNSSVISSYIKISGDSYPNQQYLETTSGNTLYGYYHDDWNYERNYQVPETRINNVVKSCIYIKAPGSGSAQAHANTMKQLWKSVHIDSTGYNEFDLVDHYDFRILDITYETLNSGNAQTLTSRLRGDYIKIVLDCNKSNYVQMRVIRMIFK